MKKNSVLLVIMLLLLPLTELAQPGSLDPTFGSGGVVTTDVSDGVEKMPYAVLQPDGKILLSGTVETDGTEDMILIRYEANGALDEGFGDNGVFQYDLSGNGNDDRARGVVILPDGKIMVLARFFNSLSSHWELALVRLNANGILDPTFGSNGVVVHALANSDLFLGGLQLRSDGKLIAQGRIDYFQFAETTLARFMPDGELDSSFGTSGYVFHDAFGSFDNAVGSVLLSGDILVTAGWAYSDAEMSNVRTILRFLEDGSLDPSFGTDGLVAPLDIAGSDLFGSIVFDGTFLYASGTATEIVDEEIIVEKYNQSGEPADDFGVNGRVTLDYAGYNDVSAQVLLDEMNRIVVCGSVFSETGKDFAVARLETDGNFDPSFGNNGWAVFDQMNDDEMDTALIQPDGKVILVGRNNNGSEAQDIVMMRLNMGNPTAIINDDATTNAEVILFPNPVHDQLTVAGLTVDTRLSLYDALGQEVAEFQSSGPSASLSLHGKKPGLYTLHVATTKGILTKLVIKQ